MAKLRNQRSCFPISIVCIVALLFAILSPYESVWKDTTASAQVDADANLKTRPFHITTTATASPLAILSIQGVFDITQPIEVVFAYKGKTTSVGTTSVSASSVEIVAPPLSGVVTLKVKDGNKFSNAVRVKILPLPTSNEPSGTVTLSWLNALANDPNTTVEEQPLIQNLIDAVQQVQNGTTVQVAIKQKKPIYLTTDSLILLDGIFLGEQQALTTQAQFRASQSDLVSIELTTFDYFALVFSALTVAIFVEPTIGGIVTLAASLVAITGFVLAVSNLTVAIINSLKEEPGLNTTACNNVTAAIAGVFTAPLKGLLEGVPLIIGPSLESVVSFGLNQFPVVQSYCQPTPTPTPTPTPPVAQYTYTSQPLVASATNTGVCFPTLPDPVTATLSYDFSTGLYSGTLNVAEFEPQAIDNSNFTFEIDPTTFQPDYVVGNFGLDPNYDPPIPYGGPFGLPIAGDITDPCELPEEPDYGQNVTYVLSTYGVSDGSATGNDWVVGVCLEESLACYFSSPGPGIWTGPN